MATKGSDTARDRRRRRIRRHARARKKIHGTAERPRLSVFRSLSNIYVQAIDDERGVTLAAVGSADAEFRKEATGGGNMAAAKVVGRLIAERLKEKGCKTVVFDRGGFLFTGRVKALADAAREAGLKI